MTDATQERAFASDGQNLLRWIERNRGAGGVMNVPIIYRLQGTLDLAALRRAFTRVVARHETLRTSFENSSGRLGQVIHAPRDVDVLVTDVAAEPDPAAAAYSSISDLLRADIDVKTAPLPFIAHLYRLTPVDQILLINVHHLVTDAWSNMLLCRDLGAYYSHALGGEDPGLPPVDWQYRDYTRWHEQRIAGPVGEAHRQYWSQTLNEARYLELPATPGRRAAQLAPSENVWFTLTEDLVKQLRQLAAEHRTSLFVITLAIFYNALFLESGQHDISIGSIFANRARREIKETVGFFANMVTLRVATGVAPSFPEVLHGTRRAVLEALNHQEYPYRSLVLSAGTSHAHQAAQVVFHMLAVPPGVAPPDGICFRGLAADTIRTPDGMGSRFDLELLLIPQADRLDGVFRYANDRYGKAFIQGIADRYLALTLSVIP